MIVRLKEVDSTNREAFRLLERSDFVIVSALRQSAGYGRNGSEWVSPGGNIFVSAGKMVSVDSLKNLSLRACFLLFNALYPFVKGDFKIKWPNDFYLNGKKVAGILSETKIKGERARAVVGIGINYNPVSLEESGYLRDFVSLSRDDMESVVIHAFEKLFSERVSDCQILSLFEKHSFFKEGDMIGFVSGNEKVEGIFKGYSEDFGIKIFHSGRVGVFFSGEVKKLRKS